MALEAGLAQPDIAGRVLAFSGLYASTPEKVPPASLLHFLHGSEDQHVPTEQVQATLVRLSELQGDATLDVASTVGHELHPALIEQAIVRLQTCVPLRSWEEAISSLQGTASDKKEISQSECGRTTESITKRTLH
jgi:phospholipase/carboxylesterase